MDPATEQTLAGARETRPEMPPPLEDTGPARPLRDRILDVVALYPERKSAVIPALRLAQERYGWLPEEAFEAVADATGVTPGDCKSVGAFYAMFRVKPGGPPQVCGWTNIASPPGGPGGPH